MYFCIVDAVMSDERLAFQRFACTVKHGVAIDHLSAATAAYAIAANPLTCLGYNWEINAGQAAHQCWTCGTVVVGNFV